MKVVLQRVISASVKVENQTIAQIEAGWLILLGIGKGDTDKMLEPMVQKILDLRVFADAEGKFNLSLLDVGGAALVVSQFTLYANCRKGRRPSFIEAASPDVARRLYEEFVQMMRSRGVSVATGQFGQDMAVSLVNDGPVTILLDSAVDL